MPQLPMIARLSRKTAEAEDIVVLELVDPAGNDLPPFSAGAHIDIELGPELVRQYSICNNPQDRSRYEIAVLREPASRGGSAAIFALVEGQLVNISEPRNRFALDEAAPRSILFAGGIGITPLLCMAERLHAIDAAFDLHYSTRSSGRAAYLGRIRQSPISPRVHFYFDDRGPAHGLKVDEALGDPAEAAHVYVCGPAGFIAFISEAAARRGYPAARIHSEYFTLAQPLDHDADSPFQISLASTGESLDIPRDRAVIDVLRDHGLTLPMSCAQGVCGTCLTKILAGVPDHRDVYLTNAERQANDRFLPCCSRARTPVLVLDL